MVAKFKAILPKLPDVQGALAEIIDAMNEAGEDPKKDLEATVSSWKGAKPSFKKTLTTGPSQIVLRVEAVGSAEGVQKWRWLDQGTKPHVITPKNASRLAFRSGFSPKTRPRSFSSGPGSVSGATVYARQVNHPGTQARDWSGTLTEKHRPRFWDAMRQAMTRVAKKTGHGG